MSSHTFRYKRRVISTSLLLLMLLLIVSAYWLFFQSRSDAMTTVHISTGIALLALCLWHFILHWPSLKKYLSQSPNKMLPSMVIAVGILVGIFTWIAPFNGLLNIGSESRFNNLELTLPAVIDEQKREYQIDQLQSSNTGPEVKLTALLGSAYTENMVMVWWLEDLDGNYIDTLYASRRFATGVMTNPANRSEYIQRPEAVPHWLHARAQQGELQVPTNDSQLADGITGATPRTDFIVRTRLPSDLPRQFVLKFEANHSFDWNEQFSENAFPDDPIYSGSGSVGQPALVYRTQVDLDNPAEFYTMDVAGRSHHSGQTGELIADLSGITTAHLNFQRFIVELE